MEETMISLALGQDFLTAFMRLPKTVQGKVRKFMTDFRRNPGSQAIHYESIEGAKDKKLHSVRIDQTYRGIVLKPEKGSTYLILWVDHHDEAYLWARNKNYSIHPVTGVIQVFDIEAIAQTPPSPQPEKTKQLFSSFKDRELIGIGVPEVMLPFVRQIKDEEEFEAQADKLPTEVEEALYLLAAGYTLQEVNNEIYSRRQPETVIDTRDFGKALETPENKRSYIVITEDEALHGILDYPLDKWRVFLHPSQRKLVELSTNGPCRVMGGAGTGKTVVAMHRARFLARHLSGDDTRILFTTYSTNLVGDILENLRKICSAKELKKIEVINLDAWAAEYLRRAGYPQKIISSGDTKKFWEIAYSYAPSSSPRPLSFYKREWEQNVQQQGISSREEYLTARRKGKGAALTRRQRLEVWKVFQSYREQLEENGVCEYEDVIRFATELLKEGKQRLNYSSVIVDEAQDFAANSFRLLSIIAETGGIHGPDSLFITGDSQQRIYGKKVVLKHCGINIMGRSHILRLNYRTTEETRSFASRILSGHNFDNLDGELFNYRAYKSILHGDDPVLFGMKNFQAELEKIKEILESITAANQEAGAICLVLRTNKLLETYARSLESLGIILTRVSKNADYPSDYPKIATMHRVKGLEFDHVIIAGAGDENIPLGYVYNYLPEGPGREEKLKAERSLLFVALTRARKSVSITWNGKGSRFLDH